MKRISSSWTAFHKKVFPVMWFGFLALFFATATLSGAVARDPSFLVVPIVMATFGFFFMRKLVWDLVDEVFDCGDALLIRNRGEEALLPLSNIMNVSVSTYSNPQRITLRLVTPGIFGGEIAFSPVTSFRLNPFAKNQVAEDLILRAYQARSARTV
jgi:hypothetical protein